MNIGKFENYSIFDISRLDTSKLSRFFIYTRMGLNVSLTDLIYSDPNLNIFQIFANSGRSTSNINLLGINENEMVLKSMTYIKMYSIFYLFDWPNYPLEWDEKMFNSIQSQSEIFADIHAFWLNR